MEKKLEVKDLVISFRTTNGKVQAVRDINFDLYTGETLAIVGESGSGKSVTSRAIIGILAGNAIVEGGEILYDGQDLLKITEEDFHKIRGDKIAMIFQDPLSSLNPIMKVGKQLTEAMILNNKASRRNARAVFGRILDSLGKNVNEATATVDKSNSKYNYEQLTTFKKFTVVSNKLESTYNVAYDKAVETIEYIDNNLFLIDKKQAIDYSKLVKTVTVGARGACAFALADLAEIEPLLLQLGKPATKTISNQEKDIVIAKLNEIKQLLQDTVKKTKPNFFCLGYYKFCNPQADITIMPVVELNKMVKQYLIDNFMTKFVALVSKGVAISHKKSIERKKAILSNIGATIEYFRSDDITKKQSLEYCAKLSSDVDFAIDRLQIHKNSIEYTLKSSLKDAIIKYFIATANNPKELARFNKQTSRRNSLIEKGKSPDWKVTPASLIDLDLARSNINFIIGRLVGEYELEINNTSFDADKETIDLIDYLKEQTSAAVNKVTNSMAKIRAVKLLEEVGIPEPIIRYNQYPFEFSGGMRQRIVIAIALSANPDILICDEPTTALDVTIQSQILELINRIKKERNLSVIFITHDLGVVANMADRIAVMYAGKIVEIGESEDIFYSPAHPYTWALLSSMPDLNTKEKLDAIPGTPPNMIYPPVGDAFASRNKYALKIDFEQQPPMYKITDTHAAATWLLHPDAPKVELPKIVADRIERMKKLGEEDNG